MGIKKLFKQQLRSVIEWKEQDTNILFHRLDTSTDEIKNSSKLIVAPGQGCLLVYDGKVKATLTEPDTYELQTDNHPFITTLLNLAQRMESEHKMRFYFFRTAELVNVLWGTATPVKYMEPNYKMPVAVGACGNFSVKIEDAAIMFSTLLGTVSDYTATDVRQLVASRIVAPLTSFLAEKAYPYTEIDKHLMEMSDDLRLKTTEELQRLGLILTDFRIDSVTFDDETLERINRIADMTAEKLAATEVDLDYAGVQKLAALRDAVRTEGGLAGAGMQIGAGVQLAKEFFNTQDNNVKPNETTTSTTTDTTARLKQLKQLFDEELITEEEYKRRRTKYLIHYERIIIIALIALITNLLVGLIVTAYSSLNLLLQVEIYCS